MARTRCISAHRLLAHESPLPQIRTIRAEPLVLVNGSQRLTLRFDCKPCEMQVVGRIKKKVPEQAAAVPLQFYRSRSAQ